MTKATEFEFRYRQVLNLVQIWLAFQVYVLDRSNVVWSFFPWSTPRGALLARLVFSVATLLVGAAAAIRTWATAYLGSSVVHDLRLRTEMLVADGPYRHVHNPLYLGTFLLSIGLGFLANRLGFLILVAGWAIRILPILLFTSSTVPLSLVSMAQRCGIQGTVSKYDSCQIVSGIEALLRHETFFCWN